MSSPPDHLTAEPGLTLDYLHGAWSARREINGDADAFVGTATFTPDPEAPDALLWQETGELRLDGYRGPASRRLHVAGDGVRFDDGRPFHPFTAGDLTHRCGSDTYQGTWTVHDADRFTVAWTVTGPGRSDRIVCDYRRRRASSSPIEGSPPGQAPPAAVRGPG